MKLNVQMATEKVKGTVRL